MNTADLICIRNVVAAGPGNQRHAAGPVSHFISATWILLFPFRFDGCFSLFPSPFRPAGTTKKKRRHSSFVPPPMNVDVFINNVEPESSLFLFFFIEIHWMTIAGCRPADRPGAAVASGCFDVGPGGGFGVDLGVGVGAYGQLRPVLVGLRPGPGRLPLRAEDVRLPARARSQLRPRLELRPGRPIAAARLRNSSRRYSSIAISFVIETVCSLTPIESLLNGVVFRC